MSRISGDPQAEAIRPAHRIFHTSRSDKVRLGRRIGTGAEGEVYEIQDKSDLVAKVYHEPPPPEKAEKLVALARLGNERLLISPPGQSRRCATRRTGRSSAS